MTRPPPTGPPPAGPARYRVRRSRALTVTGFGIAWLAVMVIGAGTGDPDANIPVPNIGDVVTAVFIVMLFMGLVVLVLSILDRAGKPTTAKKRGGIGGLFVLILIVLALNQIANRPDQVEVEVEVEVEEEVFAPAPTMPEVTRERPGDASRHQLTLLTVAALAALAAAFVIRQRRRPGPGVEVEGPEEVRSVVARRLALTARQLRSEPDPRRAVLLAYAGLEAGLDDQGQGRAPQETAYEYVGRILRSAAVDPEPVEVLAHLYHDARFSDRVITVAEQAQAALAFEQAHDQLVSQPAVDPR
ncbi:MAG: DUF4129 domain-containing protein [Actinomycetia bacterium]|nr:DUF4129 domain-containing protein [Actinomycetes bacterium]